MLRHEVEKLTGLTRKAIEYYEEKGLLVPKRDENNYRIYGEEEVEKLKQISLYRRLGLSMGEIRKLSGEASVNLLADRVREKELNLILEKKRLAVFKRFVNGNDGEMLEEELSVIEREETVYEKLTRIFPGYFGQLFFLNDRPFLLERLDEEKRISFEKYVKFMDSLPEFELSKQERAFLEQSSCEVSIEMMEDFVEQKISAVSDMETWYEENKAMIEEYNSLKESEEYRSSPMYRISERLKTFMKETNYYAIAIPLMREFSPSYDDYYQKMLEADKKFDKYKG